MKKITIWLILFSCAFNAYNQPLPDSIKAKYDAAKTDKEKGTCLVRGGKHNRILSKNKKSAKNAQQ